MTKYLARFYCRYFEWLKNGAPEHRSFKRYSGLCSAILWYYAYEPIAYFSLNELEKQFIDAQLDTDYPFGGRQVYLEEAETGIAHLNKDRIAWVERQVEIINSFQFSKGF